MALNIWNFGKKLTQAVKAPLSTALSTASSIRNTPASTQDAGPDYISALKRTWEELQRNKLQQQPEQTELPTIDLSTPQPTQQAKKTPLETYFESKNISEQGKSKLKSDIDSWKITQEQAQEIASKVLDEHTVVEQPKTSPSQNKSWWERTLEASKKQANEEKDLWLTGQAVKSAELITKAVWAPIISAPRIWQNIIATGEDILGWKYIWTEVPSVLSDAEKRRKDAQILEQKAFEKLWYTPEEAWVAKTAVDIWATTIAGAWTVWALKWLWALSKTSSLLNAPTSVIQWVKQWSVLWAWSEIPYKVVSEWRLPTIKEMAKAATVWAVTGWVTGTIPKIEKYSEAFVNWWSEWLTKSIWRDINNIQVPWKELATRSIPKKIVSRDLAFTPTERAKIEKITGNDEATYVLNKWLAGKWKEELAEHFMKQSDDMYNGITKKLEKVDKRVQSTSAKEALQDIIDQLESKPKFQRAYAEDIAAAKKMLESWDYSLTELNNIRRAYDKVNTSMYTAQWTARSGIENEIDVRVRNALSEQIQKEAKSAGVDVKAMNTDLRAGIVMKDALLRRLSQEQRNNFIGLQDIGISWILSGWHPATAIATVIAKKYGESIAPSVAQNLYNLNKTPNVPRTVTRGNTISPRNKSSILNLVDSSGNSVASSKVESTKPSIKF